MHLLLGLGYREDHLRYCCCMYGWVISSSGHGEQIATLVLTAEMTKYATWLLTVNACYVIMYMYVNIIVIWHYIKCMTNSILILFYFLFFIF